MKWGVSCLPTFKMDVSDRNRTSPFAFVGNKFEYRAVGSSQNCSRSGTVINAIMTESLNAVADELEKVLFRFFFYEFSFFVTYILNVTINSNS